MKNFSILLDRVLYGNALFSFSSGVLMLIFSDWLASIINLSYSPTFYWIGGGLIFFSLSIIPVIFIESYKIMGSRLIIIQDLVWVIGSLTLMIWNPFDTGIAGLLIVLIIAIIVFIFAYFQNYYLSKVINSNKK